jgi:DNA-binding response OmpR family regulator
MAVLVVEAYEDLRMAIVETLAKREVTCDAAGTAADAIVMLRERNYEAILIAPRLPIRSDPVMVFLRDEQPAELQKVILMTSPESEERGPSPCRVLEKPFGLRQLFASLRR